MSDDVTAEVIKRTQDLLGKYIKKPPLTEKLLKKPPFRFLHDIITSVIRGTGFLDGILTTAEMNHQNIKDKESKIAFLQKVIDAVKSSTGVPLIVRPNKIVAGHEPTKTNEFLQAIGKGIDAQKNGKVTSTSSQPAKTGAQSLTTTKRSPSNQTTKLGTPTDNSAISTKQSKSNVKDLSQTKTKDVVKKKVPMSTTSTKSNPSSRANVSHSKTKNEASSSTKQSSRQPVPLDSLESAAESHPHEEPEILEQDDESRGFASTQDPDVVPVQGVEMTRPSSAHLRQRNLTITKHLGSDLNDGAETIITQPAHLNQKEDIMKAETIGDNNTTQEETVSLRRPMSARAPSARPSSARPAAPRIRDRGEIPRTEETRPISRMVNVITENDTSNDKFANEFLIKARPAEKEDQLVLESTSLLAEEGNHGHLVDQILETQKDLGFGAVSTPKKEHLSKKTDIEWEGGRKRDRETVKQEVAKLRELIQNAARIVNPAGKRMEFVQEDVDTMNRDLETWSETTKQLTIQLQEEQRLTEQAVEPMKMQQIQLEEIIQEKRLQISLLKANILLNDKRIKNLLSEEGNHY